MKFRLFLMLLLFVPTVFADISRDEAVIAIEQAVIDIEEMKTNGFPIHSANDSLVAARQALDRADFAELIRLNPTSDLADQARKALEGLDYESFSFDGVLKFTEEVSLRKDQAFQLDDMFNVIERRMEDYKSQGIDISDAESLFFDAKKSFDADHFSEAESVSKEVNQILEDKKAQLATFNTMIVSGKSFLSKNWLSFSVVFGVVLISSSFLFKSYKLKKAKDHLRRLQIEKKTLVNLMKRTQEERYVKDSLSKIVYDIRMERYHKRMNEVKEKIPVFEGILNKNHNLDSKKLK